MNDLNSPLSKAVRIALTYTSISLVGFLLLTYIALYLPDNFLLREPVSYKLKNWLPDKIISPPGLIFVSEYKTTNQEVVRGRPEEENLKQDLEDWGREEALTHLFVSKDRCIKPGPRSARISVILHKDSIGAQKYMDWLRERDQKEAYKLEIIPVGDDGYVFWKEQPGKCSDSEKEIRLEVFFAGIIHLAQCRWTS